MLLIGNKTEVHKSELTPLRKTFVFVEQINYTTKTLNGYIVACLYACILTTLSMKKLAGLERLMQ